MYRIRLSPEMPAMPRDMSWLSPKRRRTTGNLKNVAHGQATVATSGADTQIAALPPTIPETPTTPTTPTPDKRPKTTRPVSQPQIRRAASSLGSSVGPSVGGGGESGNLFYAYARKGDDFKSRFLLTFASAPVANEWWFHVQHNFPDSSRPGPQLFSFKTDDLLAKAWKHPSLEHLKSKWMYIAFSDATGDVGGAAQGVIPIQDEEGHMLGSSAGRESGVMGEMKKEAKEMKNEVHRIEEHFEKMMEAVEKNTEKVAELAHNQANSNGTDYIGASKVSSEGSGITYFDMGVLSGHFGRMNDLLTKNNDHIDGLVRKHDEHEEQLRSTIQVLASKQTNGALDMQQLSGHLDRIQQMMESSIVERKDSAKDLSDRPQQIDFSPLTDRLERVQEAVEQNSELIKTLLEEGTGATDSKPGTPFWGKDQTPVDLLPLTAHLERIHSAIEQQSEHSKALVDFASSDRDAPGLLGKKSTNLSPDVTEHLEQIFNAVEEGNKHASGSRDDMRKLLEAHSATREVLEAGNGNEGSEKLLNALEEGNKHAEGSRDDVRKLLESQNATRGLLEASNSNDGSEKLLRALQDVSQHAKGSRDDMRKLLNSQHATQALLEASNDTEGSEKVLKALEEGNNHSLETKDYMQRLYESQTATAKAIEKGTQQGAEIQNHLLKLRESQDFTRKEIETGNKYGAESTDHLQKLLASQDVIRDAIDNGNEHNFETKELLQKLLDSQSATREAIEANGGEIDFTPMAEHLESIRESSNTNAETIQRLLETQQATHKDLDFTPLTDDLGAIRFATEQNSTHMRELVSAQQASGTSDFTPVTDRLKKIHNSLEKQASERKEASPGTGDAKFIMNALSSHLSKIQALTEQNAVHTKTLREKQSSSQNKMHVAVSETSEQVRSLVEHAGSQSERIAESERRLDQQNAQMREMMSGQREMVEVMRSLARSVTAQNKDQCDHVVVPPPRKMGRKVVGFVYDAKEGGG